MDGLLTSIIAVVGTLSGSGLTYLFGRLTARRAEQVARDERLRQERIAAYAAFAGAMTELRQAVITRWFAQQRDPDGQDTRAAWIEADKRGAAADHARFQVQLLTDDAELLRLADTAFEPITAVDEAAERSQLRMCEDRSQEILTAFIRTASRQLG
ncbi:hypothetical protein [Actinophytocola xanthii]|uniref:Uncharacterized protein n=1 Tax=Actinophytocola xanthii TaxID=1912961 RepID=A0A1Q8C936_9PSEU|nr:hypothetical protein [Actinophytocola xanthii]OLF10857.1 hypothetical protein BU204_30910 [Actinophytocola xanthii]